MAFNSEEFGKARFLSGNDLKIVLEDKLYIFKDFAQMYNCMISRDRGEFESHESSEKHQDSGESLATLIDKTLNEEYDDKEIYRYDAIVQGVWDYLIEWYIQGLCDGNIIFEGDKLLFYIFEDNPVMWLLGKHASTIIARVFQTFHDKQS